VSEKRNILYDLSDTKEGEKEGGMEEGREGEGRVIE
jgi:hypothetical protein